MEQEKACDAAVIESGVKRHAYAECILGAAQFCREPVLLAGLSFAGRRKRILKDRIQSIIRGGESMKKGVVLFGFAALLLGAVVLLSAAGNDTGKKYGRLYLTEYQVKTADEAKILDTLIKYEDAFNSHDLQKFLSCFAKDAVYMPCGTDYTKYPIGSQDCQDIIVRNFDTFKFETYYDPKISVSVSKAVVKLLLETGEYLADYTFALRREGQGWLVSETNYQNDHGK
jgi:ketosteroid isomerase-like protein